MRGGEPAADLLLQGEKVHPEQALAKLDAILYDAVALVLVRGRRLLEHATALEHGEAVPKRENGILVVALQGDRLAPGDAKAEEAFLGKRPGRHRALTFAGHPPGTHGPRLAVLRNEDGGDCFLLIAAHKGVVQMDLWHRRLLLVGGGAPVRRVVAAPRDAVLAPRAKG